LLRDEGARATAQAGARMGARADVPHAFDRCPVAGQLAERPPQEVLVERERAAVRVAVVEVDVRSLEIRRRQADTPEDRRLEVRDVARETRLDAIGVALAQLLRPRSVAARDDVVELAGRVALHVPR